MNLEVFLQVFEKHSNMKFYKVHPVGAEMFHAGGQIDIIRLIVVFRNFAHALENR